MLEQNYYKNEHYIIQNLSGNELLSYKTVRGEFK